MDCFFEADNTPQTIHSAELLDKTGWSSSLSGLYTLEGRVLSNHLP